LNNPLVSDVSASTLDADVPGFSFFARCDGTVRQFYSGEMSGVMADPGQDPAMHRTPIHEADAGFGA
jgi:hypothetical protein